ncbi:MAG: leucyl/phenylalanyl-tRNA--protein transferase [Kiritimatiellia bacterium]|jgi:leucyl/phenylalanyl-tRNA---protein transferase
MSRHHQVVPIPFPSISQMPDWGPVYVGGELSEANLFDAYSRGIFPWPSEPGAPMEWHCPNPRAILFFEDMHIPRSLSREAKARRSDYRYSIDEAFEEVITACSEIERGPYNQSWIFQDVIDAYVRMHRRGLAHSVEVWDGDELIGGLYGMSVGNVFTGESMFHRRSNASKLAVLHLIEVLQARGLTWLDIQVMTPHFERFGAVHISRTWFLRLLTWTQQQPIKLFPER